MHTFLPTILGLSVLTLSIGRLPAQTNLNGERFPQQTLFRVTRGEAIAVALGTKLSEVASWYGQTGAELRETCCRDKAVVMDRQGRLHYACAAHTAPRSHVLHTAPALAFDTSQTFMLHSLPGAQRVIYLDFTGHETKGTYWNRYIPKTMTTPPYTSDSDAGSFSDAELANIQLIWQMVAEDFAPFNVDVTTEAPGIEALRKTGSSDSAYGVRVCIGGSSEDWYGSPAGGVALLNSFAWDSDTPAFVFPADLGMDNAHSIAYAASHEVGHTLNLNHDGQSPTTEYYQGHGDWAPIMGAGFDKSVVQWSRGEYASANNKQDDIAMIARYCPLLPDRHSDDIVGAQDLNFDAPSASGIIGTRSDADLFRFVTGAGPVSFAAVPSRIAPNLDIVLALYNGVGDLVTTAAGPRMDAILSTTLPQGTYYVAIEGGGSGSPSTGYSDYGSIGEYSLSGVYSAPTTEPPVAVAQSMGAITGLPPLAVTFSGLNSSDPDGSISSYDWDFGTGTGTRQATPTFTYKTPGTYTASLVVTDNEGVSSVPDTIRVVVLNFPEVIVSEITIRRTMTTRGVQATANVTVKDLNGSVRPGAMVRGRWTVLNKGTGSRRTNKDGVATFQSPPSTRHGRFTFTVTGVSLQGFPYVPSKNQETSESISSR